MITTWMTKGFCDNGARPGIDYCLVATQINCILSSGLPQTSYQHLLSAGPYIVGQSAHYVVAVNLPLLMFWVREEGIPRVRI